MASVTYLGKDLYALGYVSTIQPIIESFGIGRGQLESSGFTFDVTNKDNQFSPDNPVSFLHGIDWQYKPILYKDDEDNIIFDGIVSNIVQNYRGTKMASIQCKDKIFQNRKTPIEYESSDWETAAEAAKNIMDAEGFTYYNQADLNKSIAYLDSESCQIKVRISQKDNLPLVTIIKKLGLYGGADVFMKQNQVCFKTWMAYSGGTSLSFDYDVPSLRPRSAPIVSTLEESFYNDYSIGYNGDGGTPATDSSNGNIGAGSRLRYGTQALEISHNEDGLNQIEFENLASAVLIGKINIWRSHSALSPTARLLQKIEFDVDYSFKNSTELGSYFKYTFSEAGWDEKIFQCTSISKSLDSRNISIEGWEVT